MTWRRGPILAVLVVVTGWGATTPPASAAPAPKSLPTLGVLVGRTFLQAVVARDLRTAAPLCAERVDFDGRVVVGAKAVRARLTRLVARVGQSRRLRKVVVMTLAQARQRFGPPPTRLSLPKRTDLLVAFGRFRRGGLIVFLAPERDRWRVVALTD